MSRPGSRQPEISARHHFAAALRLSEGERAAPYVAFAETACVATQNRQEFTKLLDQAIAIAPPRNHPEWRLENELMQRRARWLLSQVDQFFLE
jgi:predicted anti-sigma-YlaC factor YlaD